jgi:hypothetical protein
MCHIVASALVPDTCRTGLQSWATTWIPAAPADLYLLWANNLR